MRNIEKRRFYEGFTNGAIEGTQMFEIKNKKFRASLHSESYSVQSYAELEMWTEAGWKRVTYRNLKQYYMFTGSSHTENWEEVFHDALNLIMDDLVAFAGEF